VQNINYINDFVINNHKRIFRQIRISEIFLILLINRLKSEFSV